MYALYKKYDENTIKILINYKTDFYQKNIDGDTPFKYLLENYSEKNILSILSFFIFVNKYLKTQKKNLKLS